MSFQSLSLLPPLHTQFPPVASHQSRVLVHSGKAQPHVQHHFSCWPTVATTHLPQQHPRPSPGLLHTLGWPIKMAWSRRAKKDINFSFTFHLDAEHFQPGHWDSLRAEINPSWKNVGGPVYFINHKCLHPATNTWEVPRTRHYKCVNYPELTSNQFGEKNPSWTSPLRLLFITGLSFRPGLAA